MRQQGGIKGKKVFFFLGRTGNAHSTAKLPVLANSELLSGQASRVENLAGTFAFPNRLQSLKKRGEEPLPSAAAATAHCLHSAPCVRSRLASSPPELAQSPDSTAASES